MESQTHMVEHVCAVYLLHCVDLCVRVVPLSLHHFVGLSKLPQLLLQLLQPLPLLSDLRLLCLEAGHRVELSTLGHERGEI